MLHSTFRLAREAGMYPESYRKFAKHLGGIRRYGADTPFTLLEVLDVCGLDTCLWCFQRVMPGEEAERDRVLCLLMADYVEHVKHIYEDEYPGDTRISNVVAVLRRHAVGQATLEELDLVARNAHAACDSDAYVTYAARATRDAYAAHAAGYAATRAAYRVAYASGYAANATRIAAEAAGVAGYAAEREWQADRLRHYLIGETKEESIDT